MPVTGTGADGLSRLDPDVRRCLELAMALTAHEIRGPILAARATIDGLRGRMALSDLDHERLDAAASELGDLALVADSLLHWAVGKPPLRRRPSDLAGIVAEAVRWGTGSGPGSTVAVRAPSSPVTVRADPVHLRLALANVIRNAVEFAPPSVPVRVTLTRVNGTARVHVTDRGRGIRRQDRLRVLEPFDRGDAELVPGGHGLGLFIAQKIVGAHRGTVGIRSRDGGTTVTVELPTLEALPERSP